MSRILQQTAAARRARENASNWRRANPRPKINEDQGALFRRDAKRETQLGIQDFVVCRECLGKYKTLQTHVTVHSISLTDYKLKWKDEQQCEPPVMTDAMRARIRKIGLNGKGHLRTGRVKDHAERVRKWEIVKLVLDGKTDNEIADKVGRKPATICCARKRLDLAGERAIWSLGERWNTGRLALLKTATGLSASELAKALDIPAHTIDKRYPGWAASRLRPDTARKIVAWTQNTISALLALRPRGKDRLEKARILNTLFPGLSEKHRLLIAALAVTWERYHLRPEDRHLRPVNAAQLGEFVCERAWREHAGLEQGDIFKKFLGWSSPEFMANLETYLQGRSQPAHSLFAIGEIARCCGVPHNVASNALQLKGAGLPPTKMGDLILRLQVKPSRRLPYEDTESYRVGARVEDCLPRFDRLCGELRLLPKRTRTVPQKAAPSLKGKGYSDSEIEAATKAPGTPLIAARWWVAIGTRLGYDTVAVYSKEFRRAGRRSQVGTT